MANKTTFWSFLKNNYIEIPIIQRDYAQGRLGKENLRKNFLGDLKRALDKEPPYKVRLYLWNYGKRKAQSTGWSATPHHPLAVALAHSFTR